MIRATIFILTASAVNAACDNQCSGHGECMVDDVCNCHDNWGIGMSYDSGDCSDRICPFEIAWVDKPTEFGAGDKAWNNFHGYSECSGKGICDRKSGLCECFDGYEGKACKRTSCPNDCSGHGTCEYIEDLGFGVTWNQYTEYDFKTDLKEFPYFGWDNHKTRGCVCDSQYADVDCSKRMCPHGTDVLDLHENLILAERAQKQSIVFNIGDRAAPPFDDTVQTFALKFRSRLNETFTTVPIKFDRGTSTADDDVEHTDFKNDIRLALLQLPHQVIDDVEVTTEFDVTTPTNPNFKLTIAFVGNAVQGPQNLLEVVDNKCGDGCTPQLRGLHNLITTPKFYPDHLKYYAGSIEETTATNLNSYECGRRGKCDYTSGLCACFEGYSGENCNTQTTLV